MNYPDFVLTANSPGEVSGWLTPVTRELKKAYPNSRITVFVPPCDFSSGREVPVIKDLPWVDQVFGPSRFLRFLLTGRTSGFTPGKNGMVIFLGGDLTHAVLLARRLGYPAVAYSERMFGWGNFYREFYVPYPETALKLKKKGADPERVKVVGDLMLDKEEDFKISDIYKVLGIDEGKKVLTFFPASRPGHFKYLLPFYIQVIEELSKEDDFADEYVVTMAISPFIGEQDIINALKGLEGVRFVEEPIEKKEGFLEIKGRILLECGTEIIFAGGKSTALMEISHFALTIPGTNNVELAARGVPAVIILPLNKIEEIPLPGIAGLIGRLPLIGLPLKRAFINRLKERRKLLSLVNKRLGGEVLPELKGVLKPRDVAGVIKGLLKDEKRLENIKGRLKSAYTRQKAAYNLVNNLKKHLD